MHKTTLDIINANVYHECMAGNQSTEQQLLEAHPLDTPVAVGGRREMNGTTLTLGFVMMMEASSCPADAQKREDPELRARTLASMLAAAGSLKPEFDHLLQTTER